MCTFGPDEPYLAVLEAARLIDPEIGIYVTGDPRGKADPEAWPDHVVFCGRVTWERYDQLLCSVNGVIDLSTRERCLLCGAYEAVAAGKPMILSRTQTLMGYFARGAVFTDHTVVWLAAFDPQCHPRPAKAGSGTEGRSCNLAA